MSNGNNTAQVILFDADSIDADKAPAIFASGESIDAIIAKIRNEVTGVVHDVSTATGRKEIASLAHKVARSKTTLDGLGKSLVADKKKEIAAVDAHRKKVRDTLDALKAEVRLPLTQWEENEARRVDQHKQAIVAIKNFRELENEGLTSAELKARLAEIKALVVGPEYEEFEAEAALEKEFSVLELEKLIAKTENAEAEKAELERLRREAEERKAAELKAEQERQQKEREEALKREAEEKARREEQEQAQKREAEHKAALEAAERAKQQAEERAKQAAEDERRRIEEEQEKARIEEEKRAANVEHRRQINNEILAAMTGFDLEENKAKALIGAIAGGAIPHVTIKY